MSFTKNEKVLFIVGPTCSGKSLLAIKIAEKLNGEIVSADSRQIYKYMDIGTAKPTQDQLQKIKHHFIDELYPDQEFSAGEYSKQARERIEMIFKQKKIPIVVGGSGLYIEALIDGIFDSPPVDKNIRKRLYELYHEDGAEAMLEKLKEIDPRSAERMTTTNIRRIIRALEVYELTGLPISELQKRRVPADFMPVQIGLNWRRDKLYERINKRVDDMVSSGLIDEVRRILDMGYSYKLNALQTVGYKEVINYLWRKISFVEMVEVIKRNTRRYAKRQLTWFRHDSKIRWIDVESEDEIDHLKEKIIEFFKK